MGTLMGSLMGTWIGHTMGRPTRILIGKKGDEAQEWQGEKGFEEKERMERKDIRKEL